MIQSPHLQCLCPTQIVTPLMMMAMMQILTPIVVQCQIVSHTIKRQRPTNIIFPELASALDRTNVSDRNATYLLAATSQSLEDFVTENTMKFYEILELPIKFLTETDIEQKENEHFQKAKQFAQSLMVVSDVAERGVKLIQDFNSSITRNEEQKQYLLEVVYIW